MDPFGLSVFFLVAVCPLVFCANDLVEMIGDGIDKAKIAKATAAAGRRHPVFILSSLKKREETIEHILAREFGETFRSKISVNGSR